MFTQTELDAKVKKLAEQATRPIIDTTVREIGEAIAAEAGIEQVSTSVIWASLRRIGAVASGHRWFWQHNPPKGGE